MSQTAQTSIDAPLEVILVKPSPANIIQGQWYHMPLLGLVYLATCLREHGVSVGIVDAMFDSLSRQETIERIIRRCPRLVGITAMTHEIVQAVEVAKAVRRDLPETRIVIGGPHCTALPARTLEEFDAFDFGVYGEGEHTLVQLYGALKTGREEFDNIPGLVFRRNGEAVVNPPREMINDLDSLPRPAWDLYHPSERYRVFGSRGCPFKCIFCMRVLGDKVRFRSAKNVVDEIEWLVDRYHPRQISFSDETFIIRRKWVLKICDDMISRGLQKRIKWNCNGRVNITDEELLARMKEAGCVRIGFGIESGNEEILRVAQKGTTLQQIREAVAACKRVGLETEAFYILGFPGETRKTAMDTIRLAVELNTTTAAFGIMVPYPGTKVAEMVKRGEGGYRMISENWTDFDKHLGNALELNTLSRKQLECLQTKAYLWFYLRNLRLTDLAKFFWEKRRAAWWMAKKLLKMS